MRRLLFVIVCFFPLMVAAQVTSFKRIFLENRCYFTVDSHVIRPHETINLASVPPRDQQLILFTTSQHPNAEETIYFSREHAQSTSFSLLDLLNQAPHETWTMGAYTIESYFVRVCGNEKPLTDLTGKTVKKAVAGETVAEYELLFTKVSGSHHPEDLLSDYPVRILFNGVPTAVLTTDSRGILRFLLPPNTVGTMTMQALPSITREMILGKEIQPVRHRVAVQGEKILIPQQPVSGSSDW